MTSMHPAEAVAVYFLMPCLGLLVLAAAGAVLGMAYHIWKDNW